MKEEPKLLIEIGTASGTPVYLDIEALLSTRMLIQASSGGGKSYTIRRIAEQAFGKVQIIIIDPEGEFATLRERYGYVLVGKGGEAAADVRSASILARRLLEVNASAVCDISELKMPERHQWVAQFLTGLMEAPRELWHPAIVIVDEAHMYAPEKGQGESPAAGAMLDLAARGRKRGFCPIFATQRLAKLSKNATAELQNVLIGRTVQDVDLKRAADALGYSPAAARELNADLKLLDAGSFYGLGRAIGPEVVKFTVGPVHTKLPVSGAARTSSAPPVPAAVRHLLPKLADLPREAEESQQSEQYLRTRIAELEKKLAATPSVSAVDAARVETAIRERDEALASFASVGPAVLKALEAYRERSAAAGVELQQELAALIPTLTLAPAFFREGGNGQGRPAADPIPEPPLIVPPETYSSNHAAAGKRDGDLSKRILASLAEFAAIGRKAIPRATLSAWAAARGGYFSNTLGQMRSAGLIEYPQSGLVGLTEAGTRAAPKIEAPPTAKALFEACVRQAGGGLPERIMLALKQAHPRGLTRDELSSQVEARGGYYSNSLGAMKTAGFIEYPQPGRVRLADWTVRL